jgi:hypothetical protein
MSTPQTFPMASAPATKYQPRSRQPPRTSVRCVTAHIRQVGAAASLKGVQPLVRSRYTFPSRLPDPGRLAVPARPVVVGAAPARTLRFQSQAAPSFNDPLRRAAVGSLSPLDHRHLVAHSALAAQPDRSQGRPPNKARARSPSSKTACPPCVLPEAPIPVGRPYGRCRTSASGTDFHVPSSENLARPSADFCLPARNRREVSIDAGSRESSL